MKTYLYSYVWRGGRYTFEIPAESLEEADGRLRALTDGQGLRYDGVLMGRIPAVVPGSGLLVRLTVWLGNLFRRDSGS